MALSAERRLLGLAGASAVLLCYLVTNPGEAQRSEQGIRNAGTVSFPGALTGRPCKDGRAPAAPECSRLQQVSLRVC